MGIPFTPKMGFLLTATMGNLFTMTLGIQLTVSRGWAQSVEELPEIALQHFYWANVFLAEDREELEKALFVRDLFSQELDVVFLDTTSVAIHWAEETEWRKRSYSRYLRVTKDAIRIDEDKVLAESRYDGKYVLRTNTDLPAAEVAQTYKSLWRVERSFRETKSTIEVRPVFHHRDETTIGHIVAGFLTLRLEMDLQRWPDERKVEVSWPALMRDLCQLQAVHLEADGRSYLLRTDLQAAGVRPMTSVTI